MNIEAYYMYQFEVDCSSHADFPSYGCMPIAEYGEVYGDYGYFAVLTPWDTYWSTGKQHQLWHNSFRSD